MSEKLVQVPKEEIFSRRENITRIPVINKIFPLEIIDPYGGMDRAIEYVRQGKGIFVCLGPHPALVDSVHVARAILQTELGRGQIVVPMAAYQYDSWVTGWLAKHAAQYLDATVKPVVTPRTREKYPEQYTEDQERVFLSQYMLALLDCFAHKGTGVIFTHGDRAGSMDTLPVRGAISLVYIKAKKQNDTMVDNIVLFPGYIFNPKAKATEIREWDPLVPYKIIWGWPVALADAVVQSESIRDAPARMPKLDWWVHQRIIQIGKDAGVFPVRARSALKQPDLA